MAIKAREDLRITDDYVFGDVMNNPEICRELIEAVLGVPIDRIEFHHHQHDVRPTHSARGVRFDVFVKDSNGAAYDVEMQAAPQSGFSRRLGYYRSVLDVDAQSRGVDYENMKEVVVIFFTKFDLFHAGFKRYDCRTVIEQTGERLNDGTHLVILNSKGTKGEVNPIVSSFLEYMEDDKMQSSSLTRTIDNEINRLRANDDWYGDYMRYQLYVDEQVAMARNEAIREGQEIGLAQGREEGLVEGLAEGQAATEARYAQLAEKLVELGRGNELARALTDEAFRSALLAELGLT